MLLVSTVDAEVYGEVFPDGTYSVQGLWHLNGNGTDSSGNAYNGTVTGATATQSGKFGQAYNFVGDQYINIGDVALVTNATTILFWMNPNDIGNDNQYAVSKWSTSSKRVWAVAFSGPNAVIFFQGTSSGTSYE